MTWTQMKIRKSINRINQKIPDSSYKVLIISVSGSEKINSFPNYNYQPDIVKLFLFAKDP